MPRGFRTTAAGLMLCLSVPVYASGLPPVESAEQVGMSTARLAVMDSLLRHYVDAGHVPGFVAGIARHGKLVYLAAAGFQDLENQVPMTPEAMFQIRSMTQTDCVPRGYAADRAGAFVLAGPGVALYPLVCHHGSV